MKTLLLAVLMGPMVLTFGAIVFQVLNMLFDRINDRVVKDLTPYRYRIVAVATYVVVTAVFIASIYLIRLILLENVGVLP